MNNKLNITQTSMWQALQAESQTLKKNGFSAVETLSYNLGKVASLTIDARRHLINENILHLLYGLAEQAGVDGFIQGLFNGGANSSLFYAALRSPDLFSPQEQWRLAMKQMVNQRSALVSACHSGQLLSAAGKPFKHVVNIGIGGSHLGPKLVASALQHLHQSAITLHFVSNLDPYEMHLTLADLSQDETLFIIASKSFTTLETLTNARTAMSWLGSKKRIGKQCYAITADVHKAERFGIAKENVLPLWQWVGGRYSLWSAMGLSIALSIGTEQFSALLAGASAMDNHIATAALTDNLPLKLALLDVWNSTFLRLPTLAVVPYASQLQVFVPFLQQLIMESNGKCVSIDGEKISYCSSPVVWGGIGTNSQHAFHQLLMQGTHCVPVDFIVAKQSVIPYAQAQHQQLLNQVHAQSDALWFGNLESEIDPAKQIVGKKPHTIISLPQIDAYSLGALIALYEYRTIFAAKLWQINPFDQSGVEYGKKLALMKS